jgi:murein DD-endopeptidase MepM/ murein hydrolase activator NlpD
VEGYDLEKIKTSITNPFNPPRPGSDDPHQAVDIADILPVSRAAVEGRTVRALLAGNVALAASDRFPYGNLVLIETPLNELPSGWLERLKLPAPGFNFRSTSALTCPTSTPAPSWNRTEQSLYILYAHMKAPPALKTGDTPSCGAVLGAIGMTGNALNPHLHLEMRVGPAGARFTGMAHYTASATPAEMATYCTWRVSGIFALVDPMQILALLP